MVSTRPPTSKSSSPFNNPLVTVPKTLITIGIIVTFMFDSFFNSLAKSTYLSFFSHYFCFILWSAETAKSTILQILLFLLIIIRSGLLAKMRWSVCMSKSQRSLLLLLLLLFFFLLLLLPFASFSHQRKLIVFHWSVSDSKSPQISRTLLSILADLYNVLVWMVSIRPLISNSSSPHFQSLWGPFLEHRLQLVSSSLWCSTAFFVL